MHGITLWRSKGRGGKPKGNLQASWRENGRKITWNTGTLEEGEARRLAARELNRRLSASLPAHQNETPTTPVEPAGPTTWSPTSAATPPPAPPARRPISDALTRALSSHGPVGATPAAEPLSGELVEAKAKNARRMHEYFGKAMAYLTEGGLKRACRWAGREPEDMDDDEVDLLREGWSEKGQEWFGRTDIGPWGKIALASTVAGVGMYTAGTPIKQELPPAEGEKPGGGGGG